MFAYINISHPLPHTHQLAHATALLLEAHAMLCHDDGSQVYCVILPALCGELKNAINLVILSTLLYNSHCVADAEAHFKNVGPPHSTHAAEVVPVVAYELVVATHAIHATFVIKAPHTCQSCQPKQTQHVHVASAAHHVHCTAHAAFVALLPFLIIFAVPVSVSVHATYIIYHAGSRVTPVLTVKLL